MGCVDQYQICNPNAAGGINYSPLGKSVFQPTDLEKLHFNQRQKDTTWVIRSLVMGETLSKAIYGLGANALQARKTVIDNFNIPLPDNQWTIEVGGWFSNSLVGLQYALLEFATGPTHLYPRYQWVNIPSSYTVYKNTCRKQKIMQPEGYASFSILAMGIIFGIGSCFIVLSFSLEPVVWRLKGMKESSRKVIWDCSDKLQLLRMAFEAKGMGGNRDKCTGSVPLPSSPTTLMEICTDNVQHRHAATPNAHSQDISPNPNPLPESPQDLPEAEAAADTTRATEAGENIPMLAIYPERQPLEPFGDFANIQVDAEDLASGEGSRNSFTGRDDGSRNLASEH